jgi:hypothetical protein
MRERKINHKLVEEREREKSPKNKKKFFMNILNGNLWLREKYLMSD